MRHVITFGLLGLLAACGASPPRVPAPSEIAGLPKVTVSLGLHPAAGLLRDPFRSLLVLTPTLGRQATRLGTSPESAFVLVPA